MRALACRAHAPRAARPSADRIKCWTPQHRLYVGVGAFWTLCFPFGIPVLLMVMLYIARVPEMARWKRDCAWLRSVVQRALIMGVMTPSDDYDPDTITLESISVDHLRTLHETFVASELPAEPVKAAGETTSLASRMASITTMRALGKSEQSSRGTQRIGAGSHRASGGGSHRGSDGGGGRGGISSLRSSSVYLSAAATAAASEAAAASPPRIQALSDVVAAATADAADVHHAPGVGRASMEDGIGNGRASVTGDGRVSAAGSIGNGDSKRGNALKLGLPATRLIALLVQVRKNAQRSSEIRTKTVGRALSAIFFKNEKEQLLNAVLMWAKHDKSSLVAEPRENQLRWRTVYEWEALRANNTRIGERDTIERCGAADRCIVAHVAHVADSPRACAAPLAALPSRSSSFCLPTTLCTRGIGYGARGGARRGRPQFADLPRPLPLTPNRRRSTSSRSCSSRPLSPSSRRTPPCKVRARVAAFAASSL